MSKLCSYFVMRGVRCSGSDAKDSVVLRRLAELGAEVYEGTRPETAAKADIVVYTAAAPLSHPEIAIARRVVERKEFLAAFVKEFDKLIAVSGAHGKTTVSSMISWCMLSAGMSFCSHIGGDVIGMDNLLAYYGDDYIVAEACEYSRSFLELFPDISVITNIDYDHPDCYESLEDTYIAFADFLLQSKRAYIRSDYKDKLCEIAAGMNGIDGIEIYGYGYSMSDDYCATDISYKEGRYYFSVYKRGEFYGGFVINSINSVLVECALACIAVLDGIGLSKFQIMGGLSSFGGVRRRCECLGKSATGARVITDYAHHPREISSLLTNIGKLAKGRVVIVYEPHTYSRTASLADDFIYSLNFAGEIILLPTYPARETPDMGMTSYELYLAAAERGVKMRYCPDYEALYAALAGYGEKDIVLLVGAGIDYMRIYNNIG